MGGDIANLRPDLLPTSVEAKFLNLSYDKRLECLRHIIVPLYLTKKDSDGQSKFIPIAQVCAFMKTNYNFYASESQYKSWFKKWGVRRRILTSEKNDVVSTLGRRTHPGTSTSNITLGENKEVDKKQMKRFLSDQVRRAQTAPERAPGVLLSWNLPYAAYAKAWGADHSNHPSPFTTSGATPSYLTAHSPDATTPGQEPTTVGPSPTMQLVRKKAAYDRAGLFLQGRTQQLLESCAREDRITMVKYLHDLYLFSFVKAKYWGRGPRDWTAGMVSVFTSGSFDVASPLALASASPAAAGLGIFSDIEPPTQLCRWTIHLARDQIYYDDEISAEPASPLNETEQHDIQDPSSWKEWREGDQSTSSDSFVTTLSESISHQAFSLVPPEDLPLSAPSIAQSVLQDSETIRVDACKAAIVAGNADLVGQLCQKAKQLGGGYDQWHRKPENKIFEIYPFHLAATYLDGGHTCCNVLKELVNSLRGSALTHLAVDNMGHTILDSLMISVLKSHTRVTPELVSRNFEPPNRFPGEEKSICGRWDADTPAVHQLFSGGYARVPTSWKHAFCHTSAQAICHSANAIFTLGDSKFTRDSGLFVRRCTDCGLELRLGPLHTLVIVAFYLASRGMPGETMFGALAVLTRLLGLGANPRLRKQISIAEILPLDPTESGACQHKSMDALELMQTVPETLVAAWTKDCQTGWYCILHVLDLAKKMGTDLDFRTDQDMDFGMDYECHKNPFWYDLCPDVMHDDRYTPCLGPKLGIVWAAIQTELLTYRRIDTDSPWISGNFSMTALRAWLAGESEEFDTPLRYGMMKGHSQCGLFKVYVDLDQYDFEGVDLNMFPCAEDVCKYFFMNMDGHYDRASFII